MVFHSSKVKVISNVEFKINCASTLITHSANSYCFGIIRAFKYDLCLLKYNVFKQFVSWYIKKKPVVKDGRKQKQPSNKLASLINLFWHSSIKLIQVVVLFTICVYLKSDHCNTNWYRINESVCEWFYRRLLQYNSRFFKLIY